MTSAPSKCTMDRSQSLLRESEINLSLHDHSCGINLNVAKSTAEASICQRLREEREKGRDREEKRKQKNRKGHANHAEILHSVGKARIWMDGKTGSQMPIYCAFRKERWQV